MIKGWRNDPRWVAHYAARDKARIEREIMHIKAEMRLRAINEGMEREFRNLRKPAPATSADWL